jgi:hypothetical protein
MFRQLVDRIAAVQEDTLIAVDEGDLRFTTGSRGEARVVCERTRVLVERRYIDDGRANRATSHLQFMGLTLELEFRRCLAHGRLLENPALRTVHLCAGEVWKAERANANRKRRPKHRRHYVASHQTRFN